MINKNKKTLGLNMPNEMADALEKKAHSMHISTSRYCRIVLDNWVKSGEKLSLTEG